MKKIIKKMLSLFLVIIIFITSFFVPKNQVNASSFTFQEVKEIVKQAYQQGQSMGFDKTSSFIAGIGVVSLSLALYGAEKLELKSVQDLIPRLVYGSNFRDYLFNIDDYMTKVADDNINNFDQVSSENIDVSNGKLELFIPDSVINEAKQKVMDSVWTAPTTSKFFSNFYTMNFKVSEFYSSFSNFPTNLDFRSAFIDLINKPVSNDIRTFKEADYILYAQNISSILSAANLNVKTEFIVDYIKKNLSKMCDSRVDLTNYLAPYQVVTYSPKLNNFSIHRLCNTLNPIDLYQFSGRIYGFCQKEQIIFSHSFPLSLKNGLFYDKSSDTYTFIIFDRFQNIQLHTSTAIKNYPTIQENFLYVDNFSENDSTFNIWASHYTMPKIEEKNIIVTKTNFESVANIKRKKVLENQGYVIDLSNVLKSISVEQGKQNIDISTLVTDKKKDDVITENKPANPEAKDYTTELERLRQGIEAGNSTLGNIDDKLSGINSNVNTLADSYVQALERDIAEQNKREEEYKKKQNRGLQQLPLLFLDFLKVLVALLFLFFEIFSFVLNLFSIPANTTLFNDSTLEGLKFLTTANLFGFNLSPLALIQWLVFFLIMFSTVKLIINKINHIHIK